jgi:hypothetical protein
MRDVIYGYRRFFLAARLAGLDAVAFAFAFFDAALRGGMTGNKTKFSRPAPKCKVVLPP